MFGNEVGDIDVDWVLRVVLKIDNFVVGVVVWAVVEDFADVCFIVEDVLVDFVDGCVDDVVEVFGVFDKVLDIVVGDLRIVGEVGTGEGRVCVVVFNVVRGFVTVGDAALLVFVGDVGGEVEFIISVVIVTEVCVVAFDEVVVLDVLRVVWTDVNFDDIADDEVDVLTDVEVCFELEGRFDDGILVDDIVAGFVVLGDVKTDVEWFNVVSDCFVCNVIAVDDWVTITVVLGEVDDSSGLLVNGDVGFRVVVITGWTLVLRQGDPIWHCPTFFSTSEHELIREL